MISSIDKTEFATTLQNCGASIVRVADTAKLAGIETEPAGLLDGYPRAVSIAVRLAAPIMDGIDKQPPPSIHHITAESMHCSMISPYAPPIYLRRPVELNQFPFQQV